MRTLFGSFNIISILLLAGLFVSADAQVFIKDGKVMSYELIIKFKILVINIPIGEKYASANNITEQGINFKIYLNQFSETIVLEKMIPQAKPYDTLWTNSKGETKRLNDWSQVFIIRYEYPKEIDKEIYKIGKMNFVEYVESPVQIINDETPNDLHLEGNQWYLTKIQAENAWDITIGSSDIRIALIEDKGVLNHIDVNNKFVAGETGSSSDHGIKVSGVAGAETNNSLGIASLGWNISLVRMNGSNGTGIDSDIRNSADPNLSYQSDIINCSFKTIRYNPNRTYYSYNYPSVQDAVEDAQAFGAIIVASAGNPPNTTDGDLDVVPFTQWPAAYSNVIGVSATNISDQFASGYNYGFHVDVSAPSIDILTTGANNSYVRVDGTSFGSPLTAALVGLVKSLQPSLSNTEISGIIYNSAFDLGTAGWDDHFGYGRINAYVPLLVVLARNNQTVSQTATAYNNGRRLVRDGASYLHLVFASGGQIFYRKRSPWGEWQQTIKISDGSLNDFPCITIGNNGNPYVSWQRKTGTNTYDICFTVSYDNGITWDPENIHVITSMTSMVDPLPVINTDNQGIRKFVVYRSSSGLKSYTAISPLDFVWTLQSISSNSYDSYPTLTYTDPRHLLAYQNASDGKIYYRYWSTNWSAATNLSNIVPGSGVHQTPSITNIPGSTQLHVAWKKLIGSGSSIYDHLVVHRRATNYNTWTNEWFGTYYNSQEYPSITGIAINNLYLLYQTPPQFGTPYIYKMNFNGNYWGGPVSVATNGRYPSVLNCTLKIRHQDKQLSDY